MHLALISEPISKNCQLIVFHNYFNLEYIMLNILLCLGAASHCKGAWCRYEPNQDKECHEQHQPQRNGLRGQLHL